MQEAGHVIIPHLGAPKRSGFCMENRDCSRIIALCGHRQHGTH
jgi:hypothetical protein